jgi:hypothetical protein
MPFQYKKEEDNSVANAESQSKGKGNLVSNMEQLSGMSLSDVQIHENSNEPQKVGALAFAQGNDVHLGPGQQEHLGHELAHVVQQKQGKVEAINKVSGGVPLNDDPKLEKEADLMGGQAMQMKTENNTHLETSSISEGIIQREEDMSSMEETPDSSMEETGYSEMDTGDSSDVDSSDYSAGSEELDESSSATVTSTDTSADSQNPTTEAEPERPDYYQVQIDGITYLFTESEMQAVRSSIISTLSRSIVLEMQMKTSSARTLWNEFNTINNDQYIVSWLVEFTSRAEFPDQSVITAAEQANQAVSTAMATGDLNLICQAIQNAVTPVNSAISEMDKYRTQMIDGAGYWVTGLEITSSLSFAVAGSLAGAVFVPATATLGATVLNGALIGAGGGLIQSVAGEVGQSIAGTNNDGIIMPMLISTLSGGASGAIGPLIKGLSGKISEALFAKLATAFARINMDEAAAKLLLKEIIEGPFSAVVGQLVNDSIPLIKGDMTLDTFIKNLVISILGGKISDHVAARLPKDQAEVWRRIAESIE